MASSAYPLTAPKLESTTESVEDMAAAISYRGNLDAEVVPDAPVSDPPAADPPTDPETPPADAAAPPAEPVAAAPVAEPESEEVDDPNEDEVTTYARVREALPPKIRRQIDRLSRQRFNEKEKRVTAEAESALLKQQIEEMRKDGKPAEPAKPVVAAAPPPPVEAPDPEPVEADFEGQDYGLYMKALAAWEVRRVVKTAVAAVKAESEAKISALETKLAEATSRRDQAQIQNDIWMERIEQARTADPDFDATMKSEAAQKAPITPIMNEYMHEETEIGPRIAAYLVRHPEENAKIVELTKLPDKPTEAQVQKARYAVAREVGRIEDKILSAAPVAPPAAPVAAPPEPPAAAAPAAPAAPVKKPIPVSKAPAPITPVGGGAAAPVVDHSKMSGGDYIRAREQELRQKAN